MGVPKVEPEESVVELFALVEPVVVPVEPAPEMVVLVALAGAVKAIPFPLVGEPDTFGVPAVVLVKPLVTVIFADEPVVVAEPEVVSAAPVEVVVAVELADELFTLCEPAGAFVELVVCVVPDALGETAALAGPDVVPALTAVEPVVLVVELVVLTELAAELVAPPVALADDDCPLTPAVPSGSPE